MHRTQAARAARPVDSSSDASTAWQMHRHHLLAIGLAVGGAAAALLLLPGFASATRAETAADTQVHAIALPPPSPQVDRSASAASDDWTTVTIRPGQTMGQVFSDLGLPSQTLHRLLQDRELNQRLARIKAGEQFAFDIPAEGVLRALRYERDEGSHVRLALTDEGKLEREVLAREMQRRILSGSGRITRSLFADGEAAGLSNGVIFEMAKVFGYDIDFGQDLRVGDEFAVVYEEVYREGERLRTGDILVASFVNQGKRYTAFRYVFPDGRAEYFDAEGRPLKKGFLRMPIEFARLSSRFNPNRRHPVLGTIRAHRGVDYAAATGTPIKAAGDGRVSFAGTQGGYGRTVIIDHGNGITTLYAHMSRFGRFRTGQRVRQGEVIGFVGASGLATGPHLHYEFRVKGVHRDPLKVTFPKPEPLPRSELARFQLQTQPWLARLELIEGKALAAR
jgi:murein DD-endopeptidase MepM/ murein hydrolase activator NlpD